ncbi:MAG: ABC-2 transporter permease [Clostridiales bacterium]|nr:ABC-2 transporter permease [Clostridiales bacterium]
MKGLLIKDFALFRNQKKTFLIIIAMLLVFMVTGAWEASFVQMYLPFIFCIYVMSSITYDELDNGLSFLMVLPITRKQYAAEKYLFGICMGAVGILLAMILAAVLQVKETGLGGMQSWFWENIVTVGIIVLGTSFFLSVMIPVMVKFGNEKGRLVLFGLMLAVFGGGYLLLQQVRQLPEVLGKMTEVLMEAQEGVQFLFLIAAAAAIFLISYGITVHIMEKKEF